jgi:ribosomal subunit interface protein
MQTSQNPGEDIPFPYDIRFTDSASSDAVRFQVEEHLRKLGRLYNRIIDCRVAVAIPHKSKNTHSFQIHVQLDIPGKRLAVSRDVDEDDRHIKIRTAINDAFHKLTRQLEAFLETRRQSS